MITATELPEVFGFRNGDKGVHSSRSMMFGDLQELLDATAVERSYHGYPEELDEENVLGKRTAVNKEHTAWKLKALYGLDPAITVFRLLRYFWDLDAGEGRPLLALLCATSRDPLLRSLNPVMLRTPVGAPLELAMVEALLQEIAGHRFTGKTRRSIARNAATTWRTSGHVEGRQRIRTRVAPTPAATAYALALGYLEGLRGTLLFTSGWARLLDAPAEDLRELAPIASQNGWLVYRGIGEVVEVRFPDLWTPEEREALHEQA
jgi:hypothetical protein